MGKEPGRSSAGNRRDSNHALLADSRGKRPKMFMPHPTMSSDEMRARTQGVWDEFYSLPAIWKRSACTPTLRARFAFVFISKLYRQMYASTGIATDSARRERATLWARRIAKVTRRLFQATADAGSASASRASECCDRSAARTELNLPVSPFLEPAVLVTEVVCAAAITYSPRLST